MKVLVDQDLNRLKVPVWEVFETLLARSDGLVGGLEILDRLDEVVVILLQFQFDGPGERTITGQRSGCFGEIAFRLDDCPESHPL